MSRSSDLCAVDLCWCNMVKLWDLKPTRLFRDTFVLRQMQSRNYIPDIPAGWMISKSLWNNSCQQNDTSVLKTPMSHHIRLCGESSWWFLHQSRLTTSNAPGSRDNNVVWVACFTPSTASLMKLVLNQVLLMSCLVLLGLKTTDYSFKKQPSKFLNIFFHN